MQVINKKEILENPHQFLDGSQRSVIVFKSIKIGRGTYQPGWQWSKHAGPQTGKASQYHLGLIESGNMMIRTKDGAERELGPGDLFELEPGHDAWVVGEVPCVALDFMASKG